MNHALIKWFQTNHPAVTLIMASKYLNADQFLPFIEAGINDFGENRVESFLEKKESIKAPVHWHFIGTLQSKKVKKVINEIDVLHTLDRLTLIDEIEKHRLEKLPCMIQCNISNEPQKHGVDMSTLPVLLSRLKTATKIEVVGIMGMAEETTESATLSAQFNQGVTYLNAVQSVFKDAHALSMGMSQDYEWALKSGTTHVRLGRILLEDSHAI